jgi:hypothetical protein
MFEKLRGILARRRDPDLMREDEEARLRAQQELRQADQSKSDDRRALEASQKDLPFGRPCADSPALPEGRRERSPARRAAVGG